MRQKYTGKEEFLKRIKKPECPSIKVLSEELKIPKATLYAWSYSERKSKNIYGMIKKTSKRSPMKKFALLAESEEPTEQQMPIKILQ